MAWAPQLLSISPAASLSTPHFQSSTSQRTRGTESAPSLCPPRTCKRSLGLGSLGLGTFWGPPRCSIGPFLSPPPRPARCTQRKRPGIVSASSLARPAPPAFTAPRVRPCAAPRAPTAPWPLLTPRCALRAPLAAPRAFPRLLARALATPHPAPFVPRDPPRPPPQFAPSTFGASEAARPRCGARSAMAAPGRARLWARPRTPVSAWAMAICCSTETFRGGTSASDLISPGRRMRSRFLCTRATPSRTWLIAASTTAVRWRTIPQAAVAPFSSETTTLASTIEPFGSTRSARCTSTPQMFTAFRRTPPRFAGCRTALPRCCRFRFLSTIPPGSLSDPLWT